MNVKWWNGLSPESKARFQGTQAALRREIESRDERPDWYAAAIRVEV